MKTELAIEGMTCSNCARHVTEALQSTPGVAGADVNLAENRATVIWKVDAKEEVNALIASVREAGYEGAPLTSETPASGWYPLQGWRFNVVVGSIATIPMLICEWLFGLGMDHRYQWLAFALATPVQFICGYKFYRGAWLQAKKLGSNMDTLVALGSTTAYAFSIYQLLRGAHSHVYFMDAAAIITLISAGHWMESKVAVRAEQTLKGLLELAPDKARKLIDGAEAEVSVSSLTPGDLIVLRPGDHIPTDGEVVEGRSAVDESMLTGESLPVEKSAGAKLYAGSLNSDGRLIQRVTALGEETALAKIIEVVRHAQNSRAQIQKLADRISNIFVPVVIAIAAATAAWWFFAPDQARAVANVLSRVLWTPHLEEGRGAVAVFHTAAVLIIACPCAMGLATPIAIMAGANAAAHRGILIRDGEALEKSGAITTILFDKTGTLTEGKLTVAAFLPITNDPNVRHLAASLAAPSRHPLSQAVAQIDPTRLPLQKWQEHRGSGISAEHNGKTIRLGSVNWMSTLKLDSVRTFIDEWTGRGASVLLLAIDSEIVAAIALTDLLKQNARDVVDQLRADGKKVAMVTGDNRRTATAIASILDIASEWVFAEVRPEEKAKIIQKLQSGGERIAFVGDGINDSPALAAADLGIALGSGADAARQAADIVLLRTGLDGVPDSLGIAQATLRAIKQNLFWAFFYNAAGVPLAMLGFFSPILSAAAMSISDLLVIGNALRLRSWNPKKPRYRKNQGRRHPDPLIAKGNIIIEPP
jgi:Cu+-exporting ATPase